MRRRRKIATRVINGSKKKKMKELALATPNNLTTNCSRSAAVFTIYKLPKKEKKGAIGGARLFVPLSTHRFLLLFSLFSLLFSEPQLDYYRQ
jgi:hypothetical protein